MIQEKKHKSPRVKVRKNRITLLCLALVASFFLCGCNTNTKGDFPQLVIGCENYKPYNYTDEDGEFAGLDVELAREACKRMGYEPVFKQIDWSNRDALLKSGEIDCIWSCYSMDGREDEYAWVGPYMHSRQIVAVLYETPIYSLTDLNEKSVGVRAGAKAEEIFLNNSSDANLPSIANLYSLESMEELATALRNDYVDAISGYAAAVREVLRNNEIEYRFLDENIGRASLGVAFLKDGNPELQNKLSTALDEMLEDGTTEQIMEGYGVDTEKALEGLSGE